MGSRLSEASRKAIAAARQEGRRALLETEGRALLKDMGLVVPASIFVRDSREAAKARLADLKTSRVVVKVVSHEILHKSDVGGVRVLPAESAVVAAAIAEMEKAFAGKPVAGYTLDAFVEHEQALGVELLVGMRWTDDFGPTVTIGAGGIYAEFLAKSFKSGKDVAILSAEGTPRERLGAILADKAIVPLITGKLRGQKARIELSALEELSLRLMEFAAATMPHEISELEVNPLVLTASGPVALDALVKVGAEAPASEPERPLFKLKKLLEPRSAAIIGVSDSLNPGHIILNNLIREGFPRDRIYVVKPGKEEMEGCRCFPSVKALPERVDLFIVGVAAAQVPDLLDELVAEEKCEGVVLIPGGLGERSGTEGVAARVQTTLRKSRESSWRGPLINGGNCLGIRSKPGRYDTLFIPEYKLPAPDGPVAPLAIISQSGAYAICNLSKLSGLNPRYLVSVGNQNDLTVGDYLTYMKDDPEIRVFACYVEGFKPGDGLRFIKAAREIVASGRTVLLYRAGRTAAGAQATASHTASIAGDYAVTRELASGVGVMVVESLEDFEDLTRLSCHLIDKKVSGLRLGGLSSAGFECVGVADNAGRCTLASFSQKTVARIEAVFARCRIQGIVDVHNPLDVTPLMDDAGYEEVTRAMLEDENIDAAVVGCVPLSGAVTTLTAGPKHREDVQAESSVAQRLARLKKELGKPWVAVVDAGSMYDSMAALLEEKGVPTFRSIDRATRVLEAYCRVRTDAR